jgi:hypothetical protein
VHPGKVHALQVTYFGSDGAVHRDNIRVEREFDILVNGQAIGRERLEAKHRDKLFTVLYDIPNELINGAEQVEVKFVSANGGIIGGVFGIRMIDRARHDELSQS